MTTPNKNLTISLEFAAEMIAGYYVLNNLSPHIRQRFFHPHMLVEFIHQTGMEAQRVDWFRNQFEQAMERAINDASALAILAEELSDDAVDRRIKLLYAINRFVYYDLELPPNPRIDPTQKYPSPKENERIMDSIWETLEHVPLVQEEIAKQRENNRLTEWRKQQRDRAINSYHKLKDKWREKFAYYKGELRQKLLERDELENPVNTPDKNSHAKNLVVQASEAEANAETGADSA